MYVIFFDNFINKFLNIIYVISILYKFLLVQNLQRKWKSLRNSFAREQAKRKTLKSGSGTKSWKTYVYFNQLSFLSTCVGNKLTTSNLSPIYNDDELDADTETVTDNEENDKVNDSDEEHRYEDTIIQSRPSKKQKTQHKDSETQLFMSIQQSLEQRNQMTKSMDDPDRLFLLSLIDDLKQVPADKKMEVKLSIMQTISNAKKYRQQSIPSIISVGSNFDTQFSSNSIHTPIINQYSDLYQRTPSYPNFQTPYSDIHQLKNSQQNDQHRRFRTPTPSPGQNILSHSELEGSQSSSSSLATYVSEYNDVI